MKPEIIKLIADRGNVGSDHNDCTVRALSMTAKIPYWKAHQIATGAGRRKGKGMQSADLIKVASSKLFNLNYKKFEVATMTIPTFCKKFPKGSFYCRKSGHAFAIIDGICYDGTARGSRIKDVWEFVDTTKITYSNPW